MDSFVRLLKPVASPLNELSPRLVGAWHSREHRTRRITDGTYLMWIRGGDGALSIGGRQHRIAAPCMVVLPPQTAVDYAPTTTWDEHYAICSETNYDGAMRRAGSKPVHPLHPSPLLEKLLASWHENDFGEAHDTERTRQIIGLAFSESLRCRITELDHLDTHIAAVRERIRSQPNLNLDPDTEAKSVRVSRSTWERAWRRIVGEPPGVYHHTRRMELAARLLESDVSTPIATIADRCGFQDPQYFSKRFRIWSGVSPRAYRQGATGRSAFAPASESDNRLPRQAHSQVTPNARNTQMSLSETSVR